MLGSVDNDIDVSFKGGPTGRQPTLAQLGIDPSGNLRRRLQEEEREKKRTKARGSGVARNNPEQWCGGKKRTGKGVCKRPAGWGTNHKGIGKCKVHGGNLPNHIKRAAVIQYQRIMGTPKEIDPVSAIMWCIRITAGEVEYLSELIGDDRILEVSQTKEYDSEGNEIEKEFPLLVEANNFGERQLHVLIRARQEAMDRLVKFSKDAISLGLAERQVRLAEQYGELLYRLVSGLMAELILTPEQQKRAPAIVRRQLAAISSGAPSLEPIPEVIDVEVA